MFRHSDALRAALFALCGAFVVLGQGANTLADVLRVRAGTSGPQTGGSWAEAFDDLQSALSAAQPGDEIWVARGVYRPDGSGNRLATFELISGVALYGGFDGTETDRPQRNPDPETNGTVLSGDLAENDGLDRANNSENSYHVVTTDGFLEPIDSTTILDGFTIRGGNANGSFGDESGAGMLNLDASPTVRNCTFADNTAVGVMLGEGLGAGVLNVNSNPLIVNCTFRGNHANAGGGIANVDNSSPTLERCTFTANEAVGSGGGLYGEAGRPVVNDCTFTENAADLGGAAGNNRDSDLVFSGCTFTANTATGLGGGALNNAAGSSVTIERCTFMANSADQDGGAIRVASARTTITTNSRFHGNTANQWGGALYVQGGISVVLTNCVLSGNTAGARGGGIFNFGGSPTLTNCTLAANTAGFRGGGLSNTQNSAPVLSNCILWGNTDSVGSDGAAQMHTDMTGGNRPVVDHSIVQGGWTGLGGTGVLDVDPRFRRLPDDGGDGWGVGDNDDFGDLRLRSGSPGIDAGDNTVDIDLREGGLQALPDADFDGNPRRLDDPATPDTGNPIGDAPIVDLGAFEFVLAAVPGDLDGDGDVDLADYLALLPCVSGPGQPVATGCEDADLDGDGDSDLADLVRWQGEFTGER